MCDDVTESENQTFLREARLTRRQVGVGATAAATLFATGCASSSPSDASARHSSPSEQDGVLEVKSRIARIETEAGTAEAFFVAPTEGSHPGVLLWPDVAGLREAYEKMATRLAQAGYAVLAVNPYYRSSPLPIMTSFDDWRAPGGRAKIAPMREALTPSAISSDARSFVRWLETQPQVDATRKLATTGYCMGGPFAVRTAAAAPNRIGVFASFHGGGLVTDAPDSPHRLLSGLTAAALICVAQSDDARDPQAKTTLREAADAAKLTAEIEVYPSPHGWCTIDSPVYDVDQAERAWSRMLATFRATL